MKDTNLLTTPNNVLTDCLNGTTITYNGKEFVLQNDMGNAIVETASLKRGYIPIGLKEYNGIIYVVSYNPLENRVEFGSFPSPERDFSGDDFDGADYQVEGCVLTSSDFYTPNSKHPEVIQATQVIQGDPGALGDSPIVVPEETVTITEPIMSIASIPYESTYVDVVPIGVGIEDYWEMETDIGQPKFNTSKQSITNDFFQYDKLKLNTGDRFVLYYIDRTEINGITNANYITDVFLPYVSDSEIRRLFKIEVFALTQAGRKKLDIDPFLYTKDDTNTFLNGGTTENIQYNIYDFDNEGTIEIRISLEKPNYFSVKFKQYPQLTPTVKFTTLQTSDSFMQIKGYKYIFRYLSTPSPLQKGYMYYKSDHLYTNTSEGFIRNTKQLGTVVMNDLSYGTYSYEILPFTQYGFEYSLVKKGTFVVSEDLTTQEELVTLNEFWWNYIPDVDDTWELHFDTDITLTADQEITAQYLELYDVWSNCSHVIDLLVPPGIPGDPYDTNVNFTNTFKLGGPSRTKTHSKSETGNIYGVPYSTLMQSTTAKLPTPLTNYESRTQYIDDPVLTNINLRKNHFYIFAVYYTYYDSLLDQTYTKGLYRYVYTNDAFQTFYDQNQIDFSIVGYYPSQTISLSPDNAQSTFSETHILNASNTADNQTLLFDPLQQQYNSATDSPNNKIFSGHAIGPENYFNDLVSPDIFTNISGIVTNNFNSTKVFTYTIPQNAPGYIDTSIITITSDTPSPIVQLGVRQASTSGTISAPISNPPQVFGTQEDQVYSVSINKYDTKLMIIQESQDFKVNTNKIYPYYAELVNAAHYNYFYPLFYQQSREVQNNIVNNNSDSIQVNSVQLEIKQYLTTSPNLALVQYMQIDGSVINLNYYSSVVTPDLQYGLLSMQAFWNTVAGKLGTHRSSVTTGMSVAKAVKFLDATKRKDNTAQLAQVWKANRQGIIAPQQQLRQYVPIVNYFEPEEYNIREALEVSQDYNTANLFLFFGAKVPVNTYNYYKYYVKPTDYYYEAPHSTLTYNLNHNNSQSFTSTYCYKIVMGAKNKMISLQEEGADESLKIYINSKFSFQEYDQEDFFPKCLNLASQSILINESIVVKPNVDNLMQTYHDIRLDIPSDNHPVLNSSGFTIGGAGSANFIKNDYKSSDYGMNLFTLMTGQGVTTTTGTTALILWDGMSPTVNNGRTMTYTNLYNNIEHLILHTYKLDET